MYSAQKRDRLRKSLPLLLLLLSLAHSQTGQETQLHQMFQIEKSNKAVNRFFKNLNIPYKSDTVYLFIVPPMIAARIEGMITPFINHLRKQGRKEDIILLAVSDKKRAAERYLKRRNFNADYQLVVEESFLNSFEFSAGILLVPFVTKFSVRDGELLSAYSLMGTIDSSTIASFIADISKPKSKRKPKPAVKPQRIRGERYKPILAKMVRLYDTEEHPLSITYYLSVNPSGNYLALMDHMTHYIYIFDLTTGKLLTVFYPDSTEEIMFVNLPKEILAILKQMNIINPMYFTHQFACDSILMITASLPKIVIESSAKDTNLGYHNKVVIIKKGLSSNRLLTCFSFQGFPDNVRGGFSHTTASIVPQVGLVFAPFSKGWPQGSEMLDEERTPAEENPFTDEFYQKDAYQFAVFDTGGRFIRLLGRLNRQFEDLKLGYFVSEGLVRMFGDRYYLCDRYSGKIYSYNQEFVLSDSITVFDLPSLVVSAIDRSKEPLRYLLETFKSNFKRRIVDFLLTDNLCYVLLTDDEHPTIYRLNLNDKKIRKFILPLNFNGKKVKYYLLRETPAAVVVVALLESSEETFYCEFKIPKER